MVVNLHAWSEETLMYTPVKTKNITVELNNGLILKSLVWETDGTLIKKIIIFEAKGETNCRLRQAGELKHTLTMLLCVFCCKDF